ncbi:hypothetical protein T310_8670, partial [Rasamsonia emersonii CBS 393.64]
LVPDKLALVVFAPPSSCSSVIEHPSSLPGQDHHHRFSESVPAVVVAVRVFSGCWMPLKPEKPPVYKSRMVPHDITPFAEVAHARASHTVQGTESEVCPLPRFNWTWIRVLRL